ncbi:MAG: tetraacyldisaccharide 4'-kinase [Fibromonadaceae bacterium]|nr:tetraacyldisaccharide 4'-kinase [Fibromonadaceae bacterium]
MKVFHLFLASLWRIGYLIDSKTRLAPKKNIHFRTPLIGIGSLLAGGAGKTPYTAYLAEKLKAQGLNVAIICKKTGDENLWLAKKGFEVFCGNRFELCKELDGKFDLLISDDGLEDRRLSHALWICLSWGEQANSLKDIIPAGNCRSLWKDHPEIACIKKCAMDWEDTAETIEAADIVFSMKLPVNIKGDTLPAGSGIAALAGIARPHRFFSGLRNNYFLTKKIECSDHSKNIQKKAEKALKTGLPVVITEKDSVKLSEDVLQNPNLYVCELAIKYNS